MNYHLEIIKGYVSHLTDDERKELFSDYCTLCGKDNPICYCNYAIYNSDE